MGEVDKLLPEDIGVWRKRGSGKWADTFHPVTIKCFKGKHVCIRLDTPIGVIDKWVPKNTVRKVPYPKVF